MYKIIRLSDGKAYGLSHHKSGSCAEFGTGKPILMTREVANRLVRSSLVPAKVVLA